MFYCPKQEREIMLSQEQFKRIKKYLNQGRKQYAVAKLMKTTAKEVSTVNKFEYWSDYEEFKNRPRYRTPEIVYKHIDSEDINSQTKLPFEPSTIEDVMREIKIMHQDLLNKLDQLSAQK